MTIPQFITKRLLLRGICLADADSYEQSFVDYEVVRYLSHKVPWPYPKGAVRDFIETVILPKQGKSRWMWGIFPKDKSEDVMGCIDLWKEGIPEHRGFWLARKFWGHGYMTEAVVPITNYAFSDLGFERLVFSNALGNIASRRIKEKTGARYIGVRPAQFVDPKFTHSELWELTKEEWETHNQH